MQKLKPCPSCGIRYGYHLAGCAALTDVSGVSGARHNTFSEHTPMDKKKEALDGK